MITPEGLADRGSVGATNQALNEIQELLKVHAKNPVTIHVAVTVQPIDEPSTLPTADGS